MSESDPQSGNEVDLSDCDREPIHTPGSIQPHGVLLVVDTAGFVIRQASANSRAVTGREPGELLAQPVASVLGDDFAARLREWSNANPEGGGTASPLVLEVTLNGRPFTGVAHRAPLAGVVLELEPADYTHDFLFHHVYLRIEVAIRRFDDQSTLAGLLQSAAEQTRALTGFDRVMIYQFGPDFSGSVVAEDRAAGLPSWLGLHFPASDIPAQARELYLRNRIRSIPDVDYVAAPIVPSSPDGAPLDLGQASLRSVSPVHVEYLKNMRVAASMSVSIVRGGTLWGLIACHHGAPRHSPPQVRFACDFLAQTLSLLIGPRQESAHLENAAGLREARLRLLRQVDEAGSVESGFGSCPDDVLALAHASGAAMWVEGRCALVGDTPDVGQVSRLVAWLAERSGAGPFVTDALPGHYPDAAKYVRRAAGLLAVPVGRGERSFLLWFRPEVPREVRWAGDPNKPAEPAADGSRSFRLHPRKSFELWKQSVAGTSRPWMAWEVEAGRGLAEELTRKLLAEWAAAEAAGRRAAESERDRLRGAVAAMEQVLGVIGHELRTPLAGVGAMADFLLNPHAREMPEFDTYLASVRTEISGMSATVNNLVDAARLASGHAQWDWSEVSVESVCGEAIEVVRPAIDPAEVEVRVVTETPDAVMSGDPEALRRMLVHLLENAREHTAHGSIELSWHQTVDATGRWVEFRVRDTGEGIAPQLAGRLGQAFAMNAGVLGINQIGGSGLGLAICNGIAAAHGGRILVESSRTSGTKVSVRVRADLPGPVTSPGDASLTVVLT